MHILLTNDDGIHSTGLRALHQAALNRGHKVTISAPNGQCSANSQHITLTAPILIKEEDWAGSRAFAIGGTPADCVRVAPTLTGEHFDFCISGINHGLNAGSAVYYSGTVSAAREAAMLHLPALAVSLDVGGDAEMYAHLANLAIETAEKLLNEGLPRYLVVNLNAPALPPARLKPLRVCPLNPSYYLDQYEKRVSPLGQTYLWLDDGDNPGGILESVEPDTDVAFLQEGHVTCTFIGPLGDYNGIFAEKLQVSQE